MSETKIAYLRKQKGLTQAQVAADAGVTQSYLARIETGQRPMSGISLGIAARLAAALSVHAEDLLDDAVVQHNE